MPQFAPTLYVGNDGNFAGRLTGSYDLLLSQRWIVQPEAELNFYNKDDPGRRIGSGLSDLDAGVRLRYEVRRKFGPYIGFAYNGTYGNTANYSRQGGRINRQPPLRVRTSALVLKWSIATNASVEVLEGERHE